MTSVRPIDRETYEWCSIADQLSAGVYDPQLGRQLAWMTAGGHSRVCLTVPHTPRASAAARDSGLCRTRTCGTENAKLQDARNKSLSLRSRHADP